MRIKIKKYRRILLAYNFAVYLLGLPIVIYTLWQSIVIKDKRYFFQRLGFSYPSLPENSIWIHAASVGEVSAVLPLIKLLRQRFTSVPVLITTFTPTGGVFARTQISENMFHCFLPIDYFGAVQRFIKATKPQCAFVMETEIWPNLFLRCKQYDVPLTIINGRLSKRTLDTGQWLRSIYAVTLQVPSVILTRSDIDRDRFIHLGAPIENVKSIGNIKFAYNKKQSAVDAPCNILTRPYVLAASTHEDEEAVILKSWLSIDTADNLLVIAPRHPKRLAEILQKLSRLTNKIAIRSKNDTVNEDTKVYLVDTLGELTGFMPKAKFIFMGGSLVNVGGHNILEPASLGKAIVFGRFMTNFSDEAALFLDHEAALLINKDSEISNTFKQLLADPACCEKLGANAKQLVIQFQGIAAQYVQELVPYISQSNE